jgi:hypothetical protein
MMVPAGSNAPNTKSRQLCDMLRAAAPWNGSTDARGGPTL